MTLSTTPSSAPAAFRVNAGDQLTALLIGHIAIAVELLEAAESGGQRSIIRAFPLHFH